MDFVSDALFDGRPFRFTLLDDYTRDGPAFEVAHALAAWRVIHIVERVAASQGLPTIIVRENGPTLHG